MGITNIDHDLVLFHLNPAIRGEREKAVLEDSLG